MDAQQICQFDGTTIVLCRNSIYVFDSFLSCLIQFRFTSVFCYDFAVIGIRNGFKTLNHRHDGCIVRSNCRLFFTFFFAINQCCFQSCDRNIVVFTGSAQIALLQILYREFVCSIHFFAVNGLTCVLEDRGYHSRSSFCSYIFRSSCQEFPLNIFQLGI